MRWRAISTLLGRRLVIPAKAPPEEAYVWSRRHRPEQRSLIPGGPVLISGSDRPAWEEPLTAQDHAHQTCDSEFRMARLTKPDHRCPKPRDLHGIAGQKRVLSGRSVQVHCRSLPKSSHVREDQGYETKDGDQARTSKRYNPCDLKLQCDFVELGGIAAPSWHHQFHKSTTSSGS